MWLLSVSRASYMLGKYFTIELFPQLLLLPLKRNQDSYEQFREETLPDPPLWLPS